MQSYTVARKDLTEVTHGVIVHGCNCSNGFGSGVALAIKKRWPKAEQEYRKLMSGFRSYPVDALLGTVQIVEINPGLDVINGFTQLKYGRDGKRYAEPLAIQSVLNLALIHAERVGRDIFIPKIGCNLGGLKWETDVEPIVQTIGRKADLDGIRIVVCDPNLPVYGNEGYSK